MPTLNVTTALVEVRTVKLTKSLLKQMVVLSYDQVIEWMKDGSLPSRSVGWIPDAAFSNDGSRQRWLLIKVDEGSYGLYPAMSDTIAQTGAKQIYVV